MKNSVRAPRTHQNNLLVMKGGLAVIWGAGTLLMVSFIPLMAFVRTFGILNFLAAFLTFLYAYNNRELRIAHQWLLMEGMVEFIAGWVFTFFTPDLAHFTTYLAYGSLFNIFLQFFYGYAILLTGKFIFQNMALRFLSAVVGVIFACGLLTNLFTPEVSLVLAALFSLFYGWVNMQFAQRMRNFFLGSME